MSESETRVPPSLRDLQSVRFLGREAEGEAQDGDGLHRLKESRKLRDHEKRIMIKS